MQGAANLVATESNKNCGQIASEQQTNRRETDRSRRDQHITMATTDGGTPDRISGLSDDLLRSILLRLGSTPEAARTSVLARRWRRVWATLPELTFFYGNESPWSSEPVCRRIDKALVACSAPAIDRLAIWLPRAWTHFPMDRVARWLRFASRRLTGELRLSMPPHDYQDGRAMVLPPCARATCIRLDLCRNTLRFGPASGGAFTALSTLRIERGHMDCRELEDVVSSRCPGLKELTLGYVSLQGDPGVCIRSDSLEYLEIFGELKVRDHGRLEVAAPKLRALTIRGSLPEDTRISAPMLSEVCWTYDDYDPSCHQFVDVGRHLRRLEIETNSAAELMNMFDTIEELNLTVDIAEGVNEYRRFLKDINNVAKCEVLSVTFTGEEHAFRPTMLHLLKKCTRIRKLEVFLGSSEDESPCPSLCPCRLQENFIVNSINLGSLEEVEIHFDETYELLYLIELLSKKALILKKIIISYESSYDPLLIKEVREMVRSICHPDIKLEFT